MRFHRFNIPGAYPDAEPYFRYMEEVKRHWRSLGWEEIPSTEESDIKAAWSSSLQPHGEVEIPKPSRQWELKGLIGLDEQVETEFTLKLLAAFRRCTRPGERLLAIDWQHAWYYFDPNGGIQAATRDEWAMPVLPDGDSYNFLAPDFRFGVLTGWQREGPLIMFGEELLSTFVADPPQQFFRSCGPGAKARSQ